MPSNHQQTNQERVMDFQPVDFDGGEVEADAAPGCYEAIIEEVKITKTAEAKGSLPMVILEWKLNSSVEEEPTAEQEKSVGATVAGFLVFRPKGDKRGKMGIIERNKLFSNLGIDIDVIPQRIQSKADFKDLSGALKGQSMQIWVTNRTDPESGEVRTNVQYTAPKGWGGNTDSGEADEPAPTPMKRNAAPAKNGNGKKPARR
jgi:hypothetical protein